MVGQGVEGGAGVFGEPPVAGVAGEVAGVERAGVQPFDAERGEGAFEAEPLEVVLADVAARVLLPQRHAMGVVGGLHGFDGHALEVRREGPAHVGQPTSFSLPVVEQRVVEVEVDERYGRALHVVRSDWGPLCAGAR